MENALMDRWDSHFDYMQNHPNEPLLPNFLVAELNQQVGNNSTIHEEVLVRIDFLAIYPQQLYLWVGSIELMRVLRPLAYPTRACDYHYPMLYLEPEGTQVDHKTPRQL